MLQGRGKLRVACRRSDRKGDWCPWPGLLNRLKSKPYRVNCPERVQLKQLVDFQGMSRRLGGEDPRCARQLQQGWSRLQTLNSNLSNVPYTSAGGIWGATPVSPRISMPCTTPAIGSWGTLGSARVRWRRSIGLSSGASNERSF